MNHLPTPSNNTAQLAQTDPFYQAAVAELEKGYVRLNLMADAMTHALGDELAARPLYLQQVSLKLKQEQKIKLLLQAQPKPTIQPPVEHIKRVTRKLTDYGYLLPVALVLSITMLVTFVLMKHLQAPLQPSVQQKTADASQHPAIKQTVVTTTPHLQTANPADDRQVLSYVPRDGQVKTPAEQPNTQAASACQHRPVMSNQDYLNCGLQPPSNNSSDATTGFDPTL